MIVVGIRSYQDIDVNITMSQKQYKIILSYQTGTAPKQLNANPRQIRGTQQRAEGTRFTVAQRQTWHA